SVSPTISGWNSRGPSSSAWCCCLRPCRRDSRSGPTQGSPSTSFLRSLPTSLWVTARRRGVLRWARACSGDSPTSSGTAGKHLASVSSTRCQTDCNRLLDWLSVLLSSLQLCNVASHGIDELLAHDFLACPL